MRAANHIDIVIPVFNDALFLRRCLESIQNFAAGSIPHETIVVDGGSNDQPESVVAEFAGVKIISGPRGRASQMNAGAQHSTDAIGAVSEWLWFLHADCRAHSDSLKAIAALSAAANWGCFCHRIDAPHPLLRLIETVDNLRASRLHLPYGDQGIFVRRKLFNELGGYADVPLLEDLILARRLAKSMAPVVLNPMLLCDARRWQSRGICATTALNWRILWNYFVQGRTPAELAELYRQPAK